MNSKIKYTYQPLQHSDIEFFKSMFYESLYVADGDPPFPKSIIEKPELSKYYEDWGGVGDMGLIIENETEQIGAIWSRFFTSKYRGYGYVNDDTPELGIALKPAYRNQGIGATLMKKFFNQLRTSGTNSVSLSVDSRNRAINLYKRLGFKTYKVNGFSCIMMKDL